MFFGKRFGKMKKKCLKSLCAWGAAVLSVLSFGTAVPAKAAAKDWQSLYSSKLESVRKSGKSSGKMFTLYDIDKNGTPELIISLGDDSSSKCELYTCDGGKLIQLGTEGMFGTVMYSVSTNAVSVGTAGKTGASSAAYKLKDGELQSVMQAEESFDTQTGKISYFLDGEKASKSDYTSVLDKYMGGTQLILGRSFNLTKAEIEYTIKGCADYETAYKAVLDSHTSDNFFSQIFCLCDLTGDKTPELIVNYTDVYTFDGTLKNSGTIAINYPNFQDDFSYSSKASYDVLYSSKGYVVIDYKSGSSSYKQYMKYNGESFVTDKSFADIAKSGRHTYKINGKTVTGKSFKSSISSYGKIKAESMGTEFELNHDGIEKAFSGKAPVTKKTTVKKAQTSNKSSDEKASAGKKTSSSGTKSKKSGGGKTSSAKK